MRGVPGSSRDADYEYFAPDGGMTMCSALPGQYGVGKSITAFSVAVRNHRTESLLVFARGDEGADHPAIVADLPIADYIQPEVVTACVGVSLQITKVLNQHKCLVVLRLIEC